ncbi:hypothetical protein X777_05698, partial [Ooceraea biroi]
PHGAQVVEYITPAEKEEEDSFEYEECIVDDEDGKVDLSYKRNAVKFWKSGKKARRTLTSVQNSFHKVKSLQQLYRWEASVEKEACDRKSIVHDMNLRLWALEAKEQVDLPEFKAKCAQNCFPQDNNIQDAIYASRYWQLTRYRKIVCFKRKFLELKKFIMQTRVVSILEIHSRRTLTKSGESTGTFNPRVEETLFRPVNIYIQASKSGKLTSEHFKTWFSEHVTTRFMDGTLPKTTRAVDIPQDKEVQFLTIPKKTTGMIQPLDVLGFRVWKNFVRTFSDNRDVNLHSRNEIIKLQSLTHNQFSSPRFKNLFQYAWYKSGYVETHPAEFQNPVDFCYFKNEKNIPKCSICGMAAFIRCAWCGDYLCFKHFYEEYHYCTNYNP